MKSKRLEGKRCLITGGSRGLGLAIAKTFAREGARVAITYSRNTNDAEEAKKQISALSSTEPLIFQGSVADSKHVSETLKSIVSAWGGIDVLVNNAGIMQVLPLALIEEKDWDRSMEINVKGAFLFSQAALKNMIKSKAGHILNIGTFASERMVESPIHYAASKSALRGLTESLAREVGRYGIFVNLLSPGMLNVGIAQSLPQHRLNEYLSQCPLGRLGDADEIAEAAVFMVSDQNQFMSGAKVVLDGGI